MEFLIPEPEFEPQMAYIARVYQDFAFVGTRACHYSVAEKNVSCLAMGTFWLAQDKQLRVAALAFLACTGQAAESCGFSLAILGGFRFSFSHDTTKHRKQPCLTGKRERQLPAP